jgi:hypothetical protein
MQLLSHSAGVHTCHTPDCMILVPVLLTWHSTLYNDIPFTQELHLSFGYLGRVGQGNGLNTRHLLQRQLKLTISARHLH